MPYPNFAALAAYIDNTIIANGAQEITGPEMNDILNGLLTFIEQSPLNYQKAQIVSTGGSVVPTRPVVLFMTVTPTSVAWTDNIYNQQIFINTTNSPIPLSGGMVYYDINLTAKSLIPAKTIISLVKANNGNWVNVYNQSGTSEGSYSVLSDTITEEGTTYTNTDLIGASEIGFVILNKQIYTEIDNDYDFNNVNGEIEFLSVTLFEGDKIVIPHKKI